MTVILVDLSNIVHREYAVRGQDGDTNATATAVVAQVRRLASGQPHVAVCCDSGKSFRHELAEDYKATRTERDPALYHQMARAIELLKADGFPVWAAKGFEADDLIATATTKATAVIDDEGLPKYDVLIVSSDKDLTQLVGPFVAMKRPDTGVLVDTDGVVAKFGVQPSQMLDFLSLVGDASDNIRGAKGIGPTTAAKLLARFGTLDDIYEDFEKADADTRKALGFTPKLAESLEEFATRRAQVRALITLRTDVEMPFEEVFAPRVAKAAAEYNPEADYPAEDGVDDMQETAQTQDTPVIEGTIEQAEPSGDAPLPPVPESAYPKDAKPLPVAKTEESMALVPRTGEILPAYEQRMMPRDLREARIIAKDIHDGHLFSSFGSPQAVLTAVMYGAEFGIAPIASLRGIHVIEGRPSMSAQLMVALCLKSGQFEYFERISSSATEATYEAKRKGARSPQSVTYTLEQAKAAGLVKDKSAWVKDPESMLLARASSRLARIVAPDIVGGIYTPDEIEEASAA